MGNGLRQSVEFLKEVDGLKKLESTACPEPDELQERADRGSVSTWPAAREYGPGSATDAPGRPPRRPVGVRAAAAPRSSRPAIPAPPGPVIALFAPPGKFGPSDTLQTDAAIR